MDREKELNKARNQIAKFSRRLGKKGSRIHDETLEVNAVKAQALNGACGECKNLVIEDGYDRSSRPTIPALKCTTGRSPVILHFNTPLGEKADCSNYEPLS